MSGYPARELDMRPLSVAPATALVTGQPPLHYEGAQGAEQIGGLQAGPILAVTRA